MIRLCNVSTERLISFLEYNLNDKELKNAYLTLTRHSIRDFQTLKNMIGNGRKEFKNNFLITAVSQVEQNIDHANKWGREPIVFMCDDYEGSTVFRKTLKYTDKHNNCDVLLCKSPAISGLGKFGILKDISVNEAKDLLGKVVAHEKTIAGNNAFVEKMRRFGTVEAGIVKNAINFYEAQVLRQAEETKKRGINLFVLNHEEKEKIVTKQIQDIVKYLVENADVCVWGELTPAQKNRLVSASLYASGYENQLVRQQIIQTVTNYTTLSELKSDVVKQKTLDRFIIK